MPAAGALRRKSRPQWRSGPPDKRRRLSMNETNENRLLSEVELDEVTGGNPFVAWGIAIGGAILDSLTDGAFSRHSRWTGYGKPVRGKRTPQSSHARRPAVWLEHHRPRSLRNFFPACCKGTHFPRSHHCPKPSRLNRPRPLRSLGIDLPSRVAGPAILWQHGDASRWA
jgi:hypothetical protein